MNKIAKTAAATSLAVLALAGAAACTGGGDSYVPNGTVQTKWSKHTSAGSQYWLQVRYSTTGNNKNMVVGTYRVSQATYNACQPGFLTSSCTKG